MGSLSKALLPYTAELLSAYPCTCSPHHVLGTILDMKAIQATEQIKAQPSCRASAEATLLPGSIQPGLGKQRSELSASFWPTLGRDQPAGAAHTPHSYLQGILIPTWTAAPEKWQQGSVRTPRTTPSHFSSHPTLTRGYQPHHQAPAGSLQGATWPGCGDPLPSMLAWLSCF